MASNQEESQSPQRNKRRRNRGKKLSQRCHWLPYVVTGVSLTVATLLVLVMIYDCRSARDTCEEKLENCQEKNSDWTCPARLGECLEKTKACDTSCPSELERCRQLKTNTAENGTGLIIIIIALCVLGLCGKFQLPFGGNRHNNEVVLHGQQFTQLTHYTHRRYH